MSEIFGSGIKLVGALFGDPEFESLQEADYPYSGICILFSRNSRSQFLLPTLFYTFIIISAFSTN
jgi:hypothetical protein